MGSQGRFICIEQFSMKTIHSAFHELNNGSKINACKDKNPDYFINPLQDLIFFFFECKYLQKRERIEKALL